MRTPCTHARSAPILSGPPRSAAVNNKLVLRALTILDQPLSDPTFRAALLNEGFDAVEVDLHLDHLPQAGLATIYSSPGRPALWRLTLLGHDVKSGDSRPPIGFN